MEEDKKISTAVIKRLPRYYRYLGYLIDNDIKKTSSKELASMMNITASQIRQDLNNFGCFGQQGYGYDIVSLYEEIKRILGIDHVHNMVLIGAGNIGQALANFTNFEKRGFSITAIFDKSPHIIGTTIQDKQVLDISALPDYLATNHVDIAVIAVPKDNAHQIAMILANHNIKGIWNFSNIEIDLSEQGIVVENTQLTDSLMTLSYKLNEKMIIENLRSPK